MIVKAAYDLSQLVFGKDAGQLTMPLLSEGMLIGIAGSGERRIAGLRATSQGS